VQVKQMNSQRVDAPRVSPAREQQPVGTTPHSSSKPKYFCRKHGLACEKVCVHQSFAHKNYSRRFVGEKIKRNA
jgi:hypothetical protein